MASASIGTAWIQIKPSLKGVSNDIKKALGDGVTSSSTDFGNKFKSSFLVAAKSSFSSAFSEFGKRSDAAFSSFVSSAKIAGLAATGFLIAGLKQFIDSASELQSLRASFESMTGSAKAATKVMQSLYQYGKETAFTNEQINQTARLFLGAGTSASDLLGIMRKVGDLAGATGADLQGLALPISQAFAAGKLQTQDWYQILNQGGGVFKKYIIAALGAGHSTKTWANDLSKGAINVEVLNKALDLASKKGGAAFQGAIKQANTFKGRMSNLQEAITNVGLAVLGVDSTTGEVDPSGIFAKLSNSVADATNWLTKNKDKITEWVGSVIDAAKKTLKWVDDNKDLVKILLEGYAAFKLLQIGVGAYRSAMDTLKPYGSLLKGIYQGAVGIAQSSAVQSAGAWVAGASRTTKAWLATRVTLVGNWLASASISVANATVAAGAWVAGAAKTTAAWIASAIATGAAWVARTAIMVAGAVATTVAMGIQAAAAGLAYVAAAAVAAAAWVVANAAMLGGIGLIVLGVIAAVALIVANWGKITKFVKDSWDNIKKVWNNVSGWFTSKFKDAYNGVTGVFRGLGNFFGGLWNTIKSKFNKVGDMVGKAVNAGFKGALNGVVGWIEDRINSMINSVNGIIGTVDKFTPGKLGRIPTVHLPRFADGGGVFGPGTGTSDSIPTMLSNGEYVIKASTARKVGYDNLDKLNENGHMGNNSPTNVVININGYDKDKKELAQEVSKIIALQRARVVG